MWHTKAHTTGVVLLVTIPLSPARPPNKLFYFKPPPQNGGPKLSGGYSLLTRRAS